MLHILRKGAPLIILIYIKIKLSAIAFLIQNKIRVVNFHNLGPSLYHSNSMLRKRNARKFCRCPERQTRLGERYSFGCINIYIKKGFDSSLIEYFHSYMYIMDRTVQESLN